MIHTAMLHKNYFIKLIIKREIGKEREYIY